MQATMTQQAYRLVERFFGSGWASWNNVGPYSDLEKAEDDARRRLVGCHTMTSTVIYDAANVVVKTITRSQALADRCVCEYCI